MNLESFLFLVHKEICLGITKISKKKTYFKSPIFKGPNEIWYCAVGDYSPKIVIRFGREVFSVQFNKLEYNSKDYLSGSDNKFNLFYKLVSNDNPEITKPFREEVLSLYNQYLNNYINTFQNRLISKIDYYKAKFEEPLSKINKQNHKYFEEPNIKVFKIIKGSKVIRHKRGEGFWISVHENHTYDIEVINSFKDDVKIKNIKQYLKLKERNIHYEEEYRYTEGKRIEYSNRILDLDFSFMLNNVDLELLPHLVKHGHFSNHKNWITKEILVFYSFLFFGDVNSLIKELREKYDKIGYSGYRLLYEAYFKIYQSYLNRNILLFSNGFKDYTKDLHFYKPENYTEIKEEVYNLSSSTDLDNSFNNFIINCDLPLNNYVDVIGLVYNFIKKNK